jgi:hypothetical protein
MIIAGFCVTAGVILFVSIKVDDQTSAAAPPGHVHSTASNGHSGAASSASTSPSSTASVAALPIVASGQGDGSGPAQFTDPDVVAAVMAAAKTGVQAVDTYDYRNLNSAIAAGLAATTGQFQTSYRSDMTDEVAATAPDAQTVQLCTVEKVGITAVSDDLSRASVLIFGRLQTTDTTTGTTPRVTQVTLGVTLDNVSGVWLISAVNDFSTAVGQAQPPGSRALFDAAAAGAQEVVNLLSFTRANFGDDFGRALAGLTGPLLAEQQAQRESTLAGMTGQQVDYVGEIRCIGIESVSDDAVLMLVAATSYSVNDAGVKSIEAFDKLEIGVTRINGHWLVNQLQAVASD